MKAVYPGSFDPITNGHLDIITRASHIFDELIVAVLVNSAKTPMFSAEERVQMVRDSVRHLPNVTVQTFNGLTVDFARTNGAKVLIRGLRVMSDYEAEMQMAQTNRNIDPEIETLFMSTCLEYSFLSSTIAKEIAFYEAGVEKLVPPAVVSKFNEKYKNNK